MSERGSCNVNCGCGCFGCLVAIVSFILICYIFNCELAKKVVIRCVTDITTAVHSASSDNGMK